MVTVVGNSNLTYEDPAYLAVYRNELCRRRDNRLRYGDGASGSVQVAHILARRMDEAWVQRREARGKWVFANQSLWARSPGSNYRPGFYNKSTPNYPSSSNRQRKVMTLKEWRVKLGICNTTATPLHYLFMAQLKYPLPMPTILRFADSLTDYLTICRQSSSLQRHCLL